MKSKQKKNVSLRTNRTLKKIENRVTDDDDDDDQPANMTKFTKRKLSQHQKWNANQINETAAETKRKAVNKIKYTEKNERMGK